MWELQPTLSSVWDYVSPEGRHAPTVSQEGPITSRPFCVWAGCCGQGGSCCLEASEQGLEEQLRF